jgi:hypothetical protein
MEWSSNWNSGTGCRSRSRHWHPGGSALNVGWYCRALPTALEFSVLWISIEMEPVFVFGQAETANLPNAKACEHSVGGVPTAGPPFAKTLQTYAVFLLPTSHAGMVSKIKKRWNRDLR